MVNGRFYLVDSSAYWRASRANKSSGWGAAYAQIQVSMTLKSTRGVTIFLRISYSLGPAALTRTLRTVSGKAPASEMLGDSS
jgi:hypothetical protein